MVWIIVIAVIVVTVGVIWGIRRTKVLKSKQKLEQEMQGVIASFQDLKGRVQESQLRDHEKETVVKNIDQNIETLERWKNTALPNITLFKNHTEPIEKEFRGLQENVERELSRYDELADAIKSPPTSGS